MDSWFSAILNRLLLLSGGLLSGQFLGFVGLSAFVLWCFYVRYGIGKKIEWGIEKGVAISNATDLIVPELMSPANHERWWSQLEQVMVVFALTGVGRWLLRPPLPPGHLLGGRRRGL